MTLVGLMVAFYDQFFWRWLPLPGRPPVLRGTWKLALTRRSGPGATAPPGGALCCYVRIRQTASSIHARLLFADGESRASAATLARDADGTRRLLLFYDFEPHRPTAGSPRRKGAASLEIVTAPRLVVRGRYWSDALTLGDIESEGRSRNLYNGFADAADGTYSPVRAPRERLVAIVQRVRRAFRN